MCLCRTISAHALGQALLQTAVLATVAAGPVNLTVILPGAGIRHGGQLAASEKSLGGDRLMVNSPTEEGPLRQICRNLSYKRLIMVCQLFKL